MNIFPEHTIVPLAIGFTDATGAAIQPERLTVELRDGDMEPLAVLFEGVPAQGATAQELAVPLEYATAPDGELNPRVVNVTMTLASGAQVRKQIIYGIEPLEKLTVMQNSFQTLPRALVEGSQMVNLVTFNAEEAEARKVAALIEAYDRIINLRLTYSVIVGDRTCWHYLDSGSWDEMSEDTFNTQVPTRLRRALRQAQLIEADEILQGNVIARKISAGIQNETIGESSVTLRAGVTNNGVSNFALSVLAPFIDRRITIGRA